MGSSRLLSPLRDAGFSERDFLHLCRTLLTCPSCGLRLQGSLRVWDVIYIFTNSGPVPSLPPSCPPSTALAPHCFMLCLLFLPSCFPGTSVGLAFSTYFPNYISLQVGPPTPVIQREIEGCHGNDLTLNQVVLCRVLGPRGPQVPLKTGVFRFGCGKGWAEHVTEWVGPRSWTP